MGGRLVEKITRNAGYAARCSLLQRNSPRDHEGGFATLRDLCAIFADRREIGRQRRGCVETQAEEAPPVVKID